MSICADFSQDSSVTARLSRSRCVLSGSRWCPSLRRSGLQPVTYDSKSRGCLPGPFTFHPTGPRALCLASVVLLVLGWKMLPAGYRLQVELAGRNRAGNEGTPQSGLTAARGLREAQGVCRASIPAALRLQLRSDHRLFQPLSPSPGTTRDRKL